MSEASLPAHAVGIDLGTTNCALAHTPLAGEQDTPPETFKVPQVVHAGEVRPDGLLPSFLYLPSKVELPAGALALPWDAKRSFTVGAFARERGAASPPRLVSSAKSWLSYPGVDRRADILPWHAPEGVPRLSPLDASARYLEHLREAWDADHPGAPLAQQDMVLTVPASFDAVARDLTVEAARRAGLEEGFRLLEEPQAALYAWLADRGPAWRKEVSVGDVILVVDIGGGTTDFSLVAVREDQGALQLERVAVGDHILLGGDNMDYALAYTVRARLEQEGTKLDDWQLWGLTHSCRVAKEALFSDPTRETHPLVIASRGRRLVAGTIRTELSRAELDSTLLEGFLPVVNVDERPQAARRVGLTTLGLPYATDAAITRHLAAFIGREGLERPSKHTFVHPTAILFNGGVTRSPIIRKRLHGILSMWVEGEQGKRPKILEGLDPDLSVCRGAAFYARTRRTGGVRIKGGTVQAYYVGIERTELAVPGIPPRVDAVCIAPFGMEEGTEVEMPQSFGLVVGEPTEFRFFGSSTRRRDQVGTAIPLLEGVAPTELAPIETILEGTPGQIVPVRLRARITEVGALELSAVENESGQRWKLSFNVRIK